MREPLAGEDSGQGRGGQRRRVPSLRTEHPQPSTTPMVDEVPRGDAVGKRSRVLCPPQLQESVLQPRLVAKRRPEAGQQEDVIGRSSRKPEASGGWPARGRRKRKALRPGRGCSAEGSPSGQPTSLPSCAKVQVPSLAMTSLAAGPDNTYSLTGCDGENGSTATTTSGAPGSTSPPIIMSIGLPG